MNNNNSSIIQNALQDLFMEAISPGSRTSASASARTPSRTERPSEIPVTRNRPIRTNMGTMPTNVQTQRVNVLNGMIRDYNKNILEYQRNMRDIIDTVYEIQPVNSVIYNMAETTSPNVSQPAANEPYVNTQSRTRPSSRPNSRPSNQPRTRAPIYNPYAYFEYTISPLHNTNYTHSGLTSAQIALHTRPLVYDSSMSTNTCPISLDTFQAGDAILEICGCGHIFKETHLRTWLTRNFRCPVCRYDVQTYRSTTQAQSPVQIPVSSSNTRNHIFDEYDETDSSADEEESKEEDVLEEEKTDDISRNPINTTYSTNNSNEIMQNLTRGMMQNTDIADGNVYSFEIPLYDASYNT